MCVCSDFYFLAHTHSIHKRLTVSARTQKRQGRDSHRERTNDLLHLTNLHENTPEKCYATSEGSRASPNICSRLGGRPGADFPVATQRTGAAMSAACGV